MWMVSKFMACPSFNECSIEVIDHFAATYHKMEKQLVLLNAFSDPLCSMYSGRFLIAIKLSSSNKFFNISSFYR